MLQIQQSGISHKELQIRAENEELKHIKESDKEDSNKEEGFVRGLE